MLDFQFFARRKTSIVLDYHNVIVCLDNRLVVYSSRGETASPEESRVFSSFLSLFLLFFFFLFFLDICEKVFHPKYIILLFYACILFIFFSSFNKYYEKFPSKEKLLLEIQSMMIWFLLVFFFFFFRQSAYVDSSLEKKISRRLILISLSSRLVNINK